MKLILEAFTRKWGNYPLEVFVITIGVLGAFMLNNWNQNRINSISENLALKEINTEFQLNTEELESATQNVSKGFISLFDGETLKGWKAADMSWWSVKKGAITAEITDEKPCTENQYLFSEYGQMADFELKLKHRLVSQHNVNGGFQFRSEHYDLADCKGYQVDNNTKTDWLVRLYDEFGRHTLSFRGERTIFSEKGVASKTTLPEAKEKAHFKLEQWHNYHLICKGNKITLYVNEKLVAEVIDNDPENFDPSGLLALQLHSGKSMLVQFKDIWYKEL
tara:strand:- start:35813 stop:36646 length:834 start_codon:yes stop_codon:yes gene_type:complete